MSITHEKQLEQIIESLDQLKVESNRLNSNQILESLKNNFLNIVQFDESFKSLKTEFLDCCNVLNSVQDQINALRDLQVFG